MKYFLQHIFCLLTLIGHSQDSIIFHSGFEENIVPTYNTYHISEINAVWFSAWNSPDVFSTNASHIDMAVPYNFAGYQVPFKDNAYGGFYTYTRGLTGSPNREWLGVKLPYNLTTDNFYCFKAYITLADTFNYASGNIGIYFGSDSIYMIPPPPPPPLPTDYNYVVQTPANQLFLDHIGWTEINLTYQAKGDERYMYIGNFSPDNLIDYQYVGTDGDSTFGYAYYYIDEVTLYKCEKVGIEEDKPQPLTIYPNPTSSVVYVNTQKPVALTLFNALGQQVLQSTQPQLDCSALPNGVYVLHVQQGKNVSYKRLVIQH